MQKQESLGLVRISIKVEFTEEGFACYLFYELGLSSLLETRSLLKAISF